MASKKPDTSSGSAKADSLLNELIEELGLNEDSKASQPGKETAKTDAAKEKPAPKGAEGDSMAGESRPPKESEAKQEAVEKNPASKPQDSVPVSRKDAVAATASAGMADAGASGTKAEIAKKSPGEAVIRRAQQDTAPVVKLPESVVPGGKTSPSSKEARDSADALQDDKPSSTELREKEPMESPQGRRVEDSEPTEKPSDPVKSTAAGVGTPTPEDENLSFVQNLVDEGNNPTDDVLVEEEFDDLLLQRKRSNVVVWMVILISLAVLGSVIGYVYTKKPKLFRAFLSGRLAEHKRSRAQRKRDRELFEHSRKKAKYGTLKIESYPEDASVSIFLNDRKINLMPRNLKKQMAIAQKRWDADELVRRKKEDELLAKKKLTEEQIKERRDKRAKMRPFVKSPHLLRNLKLESWKGGEMAHHYYKIRVEKPGYHPQEDTVYRNSWEQVGLSFMCTKMFILEMTDAEKARRKQLKEEKEKEDAERLKKKTTTRKRRKKK